MTIEKIYEAGSNLCGSSSRVHFRVTGCSAGTTKLTITRFFRGDVDTHDAPADFMFEVRDGYHRPPQRSELDEMHEKAQKLAQMREELQAVSTKCKEAIAATEGEVALTQQLETELDMIEENIQALDREYFGGIREDCKDLLPLLYGEGCERTLYAGNYDSEFDRTRRALESAKGDLVQEDTKLDTARNKRIAASMKLEEAKALLALAEKVIELKKRADEAEPPPEADELAMLTLRELATNGIWEQALAAEEARLK